MRLLKIFTVAACVVSALSISSAAEIPDSLLTDDYVYEYTFSDFDKARQIMSGLRTKKSLSAYRLDKTEGDLWFNTGHYSKALRFYGNALNCDSAKLDSGKRMDMIHRMISCYDCLHLESRKTEYVELLLLEARKAGDKAMESIALFNMGKTAYYQNDRERGYRYMEQAVEMMEQSDYKYRSDNLRFNYNTLIIALLRDKREEDALRMMDRLEAVPAGDEPGLSKMDGLSEKERKALYANRAVALERLGRQQEAETFYRRFNEVGGKPDRDDYLIIPYLFERKMYDRIIDINTRRKAGYSADADTINYHMLTIYRQLAKAYRGKGNYRIAADCFEQTAILSDSLKNREQRSAALELATVYDLKEKELVITRQEAEAQRNRLLLWCAVTAALLLGVGLWRTLYVNRVMRRKNKVILQQMEELMTYKSEYFSDLKKEYGNQATEDRLPDDNPDKKLFQQIEYAIMSRKLFLDPDFSRETLLKEFGIPKNNFSRLFKDFSDTSFVGYINGMRIEYAVEQMECNPNYTLEAVAEMSGLSKTQFYRLFEKKFGMTPTLYRRLKSKRSDS